MELNDPATLCSLIELVLSIISTGLYANVPCPCGITKLQFSYGMIFGFLVIDIIFAIRAIRGLSIDKEITTITGLAGLILLVTAGAFLADSIVDGCCEYSSYYNQVFILAILVMINAIIHGIDLALGLKK